MMTVPPEENPLDLYRRACLKWGMSNELIVLMEECAELQKECAKFLRTCGRKGDVELLAEELADVTIMVEQITLNMGLAESVNRYKIFKLRRLETRLNERSVQK